MKTSESIKAVSGALLSFHKEMHAVKKTSVNPFFKSKYADLSTILEAIKEPLQKAGLTFVQFPDEDKLTTRIIHAESGEYLEATMSLMPVKQDPQAQGSSQTYARRFALQAILGLATADDDGNATNSASVAPSVAQSGQVTPTANLGNCGKCGAINKISKQGKKYCSKTCWLPPKEEQLPDIQVDEVPIPINEISF